MKRPLLLGVTTLILLVAEGTVGRSPLHAATTSTTATSAAIQGFGDRQNSTPWAMVWWKGNLYVGTDRNMACVQAATQVLHLVAGVTYPPNDPDISCTPSPQDLALQAEIWRWTPSTNVWNRVFQSPNDVPIPGHPGKFVARDTGFRTITVFTEADGTEALYIGGTTSRSFNGNKLPPPRILRSVDGQTWTPIPQDPGTTLGNTTANGFRSMTVYNKRLYLVASTGLVGTGTVYVAGNPAGGNNNFQKFTPATMGIFEMAAFNGFLYLGSGGNPLYEASGTPHPFTVWKTTGAQPATFTPVVTAGAYRPTTSDGVVSMYVFAGMLYFGTNVPAEVYRIHSDDTWDLVVGSPRTAPNGQTINPLSGMLTGFNWPYTAHIWRMGSDSNQLYVGTFDQSTQDRNMPGSPYQTPAFQAQLGFDLYKTSDGVNFQAVTTNGFGDKFSFGVRQLVSTPYGLFIGGVNPYYGLQIWQLPAAPAPTPTGTATTSPTGLPSPSATATAAATATVSAPTTPPTATGTQSPSPTGVPSATATNSPTATGTPSPSRTATATKTATPIRTSPSATTTTLPATGTPGSPPTVVPIIPSTTATAITIAPPTATAESTATTVSSPTATGTSWKHVFRIYIPV